VVRDYAVVALAQPSFFLSIESGSSQTETFILVKQLLRVQMDQPDAVEPTELNAQIDRQLDDTEIENERNTEFSGEAETVSFDLDTALETIAGDE